ncbi:Oxoglutarate/iron-dependent dioxygenase [Corchorus olitorius]|uniref:Oxoglutarate/iron-dependent dioxygenase n=1 Tax=Corchorus olitorius TaxID=93759 RepID=A0A1R3GM55_9ROSI|nr:Oxoglutarate/iron-dependent dioxygenase [Corchorus olitorius]
MAATSPSVSQPKLRSIKAVAAELPALTSIPSVYNFQTIPNNIINDIETFSEADESMIPTIDFSLLTSSNPEERSKVIQDLAKACQDWGFFMVTNHGVPESMMKAMIEACRAFFELPEEEKQEFEGKHVLDPISEIALEFSKRVRQVAREITRGISESLGLELDYIDKALDLENGLQLLIANLYPPCPQPELAMGLPPHSDHGLVTLLIQNEIGGLQVKPQGKWINVNPIPNSFLANIGDHIEILSNGKYKSVLHRAVVNNKDTRISIAIPHGPAPDAAVSPASELVDRVSNPPAYKAIKYKEYIELQQSHNLDWKSALERIRLYDIEYNN